MHNDLTFSANCEVPNILDFFLSHFVSLIRLNKLCCRYVDIKQCNVDNLLEIFIKCLHIHHFIGTNTSPS